VFWETEAFAGGLWAMAGAANKAKTESVINNLLMGKTLFIEVQAEAASPGIG